MSDSVRRPTRSFVLKLWAQPARDACVWRASLTPIDQSPTVAQGFPSFEAAVTYLNETMTALEQQADNDK